MTAGGRAAVAVLVAALALACGCSATPVRPAPAPTPPPIDCVASLREGRLPDWASSGFTHSGAGYTHVEGVSGLVVGVLFGYPLTSPPRPTRVNKILWVAREPGAEPSLAIDAQREGAGPVVHREVGFGGGQSIIDLPAPGCWRLTLHWGAGLSDTVDLPYVDPSTVPGGG